LLGIICSYKTQAHLARESVIFVYL